MMSIKAATINTPISFVKHFSEVIIILASVG